MFKSENKVGLYITVAIHLLVIIALLITKIGYVLNEEEKTIVIDLTGKEESIKQEREAQLKMDVSKELDEILSSRTNIRNIAVDASKSGKTLKDDRFKNPNQVYEEAKRLQDRLNASKKEAEANQGDQEISQQVKDHKKTETYKGPSVISYIVEGRKAMSLPIPVYKCLGGGDVSVAIIVNRKGYVISAQVIANASSPEPCLQEYAVKAAKSSRFTSSATAPEKQPGEIVYRFISQ